MGCLGDSVVDRAPYLVEADDVGVLQQLHDLHLSEDLLQVLVVQLGLIHYFYRHLERQTDGTEVEG